MKTNKLFIIIIIIFSYIYCVKSFEHPGVFVNGKQLEFIKEKIQNKEDPIYTAFLNANKTTYTSPSYTPRGPPVSGTIECGSYSSPDYGCSADGYDSSAAYAQALWWYITGNPVYAKNAIAILNNYANILVQFNNTNAPLQAAWSALKITRGAEIIRHSNSSWSDTEYNKFVSMMYRVYGGSNANGNWELSMIDGMFGIAVLSDNQTMFDHAALFWRQRIPAYFYNFGIDNITHVVTTPRGKQTWNGETVFNASTSGVSQETCRDMLHTQMGLNSAINAAETAWIQGLDLYSEELPRITTSLEFHAKILLNYSYPSFLCNGTAVLDPTTAAATFETAYSAYHTRLGVPLNYTYAHIVKDVRPIKYQYNSLTNIFESLTSSEIYPTTTTTTSGGQSTTSDGQSTTIQSTQSPSTTNASISFGGLCAVWFSVLVALLLVL